MPITDFTYTGYLQLINYITDQGYNITNYHEYQNISNPCILCHDIDFDVDKALILAKIEAETLSVCSTYFILINTNFYNVFSNSINNKIKEIINMGHEIGLHFDETCYQSLSYSEKNMYESSKILIYIKKEISMLEQIIEKPVKTFSMHRPSKFILDENIVIPNVINRYSKIFLNDFKYISDSRHNWREDAESIVLSKKHEKLHILTHPFWYTDKKESCRIKLLRFIINARKDRYFEMSDNFRQLDEFVKLKDIE